MRRFFLKSNGMALLPPPEDAIGDYPVRSTEKLRFADTDRNGHITHSVFAVCCQNARMELLLETAGGALPEGTHVAVVRLELDFVSEMHWPGTVEIGTRVERVGRSSVTLAQGLFIDGRLVARSRSVTVLIDGAMRQATALPPAMADALYALGPSEEVRLRPRPRTLQRLLDIMRVRA